MIQRTRTTETAAMRTPLLSRFLTIAFVLGLCLAAVLGRDLRLGKDLRGGVSLVYKVEIPEEEIDPQSVLDTTIEVLKARVNPQGIFDISIEGSGRDRIEVVMPLPGPETRALAAAWRTALDELVDSAEIRESEVLATLEEGEIGDLRGPDGSARATAFDALVAADAARKEAREAYNAVPNDAASTDRNLAAAAVADAEISFDDSLAALMELGLSGERVRRILTLPNKPILERDEEGRGRRDESGNPIFGPGQRDKAFASLQAEYPDLESALTKVQSAYDQYESQRTGFDDPEDLKRLLRGAGVLEFHIGVSSADPQGVDVAGLRRQLEELGAGNTQSPLASWYPINDLGQWYEKPAELAALTANPEGYFAATRDLVATRQDGIYYLLLRDDAGKALTASDDDWRLVRASEGQDRLGRPSINFALDQSGALRMGQLTGANKGRNMAIVLDSEVYSAPTIQSQISGNGQITGNFGAEEIAYLRKVLGAGSLSAQLSSEPISESVLGPSIGADNLERGTEAFLFALVVVAIFMGLWYFQAGLIADLALLANGLVIFGVLMGVDATFTLPGLAGIVLTVGMAVDANVLIFERIREELALGDVVLRQAVKNGYAKALSTILDGNITNLIVCGALYLTATAEVKGFAVTLTVGILATLFSALFITRQCFLLYTDVMGSKRLSMLPIAVPSLGKALQPNIDFMALRWPMRLFSAGLVAASLLLVSMRGADLLDTEFRGGVSIVMETKPEGEGRLMLARAEVEQEVRALANEISTADVDPSTEDGQRALILSQLGSAAVVTVGETATDAEGNTTASRFQVKVASPAELPVDVAIDRVVVDTLVDRFSDRLDIDPPVTFAGMDDQNPGGRVMAVTRPTLGGVLGRADIRDRTTDMLGGAAVLLEDLSPALTADDIERRVARMRSQPDFREASSRQIRVIGIEGGPEGWSSAAVLVRDEFRNYNEVDPELWQRDMADVEWNLIGQALRQPPSLSEVASFSSSIAATLKANAYVAVFFSFLGILVYIWIRFGSLRYSFGAVLALVHDVSLTLGALAVTGVLATGDGGLLGPYRIDLGVVAGLLTIIGYSLNDTIVILDRIRENRGRRRMATPKIINASINQTLSRTLLTSGTTLFSVLILFLEGGSGMRAFCFTLLAGLVVGTYSSIAIAAPLTWTNDGTRQDPAPTGGSEAVSA